MSRALPAHTNLEHLRKQAKDLLRELQRVQSVHGKTLTVSDATGDQVIVFERIVH